MILLLIKKYFDFLHWFLCKIAFYIFIWILICNFDEEVAPRIKFFTCINKTLINIRAKVIWIHLLKSYFYLKLQ